MADRMLFLGWTGVVRGREERALEVFNESMGLYGRLQQEGRIESFDAVMLLPNGTLDGYMQIHGSAEQLAALKEDPDFRRLMADAGMIIEGMCLVDGMTNEAIAAQMALYQEAIAKVPQHS